MTNVTPDLTDNERQLLHELAGGPTTTLIISDDDLQAVGYLIDTSTIKKTGWEDRYLAALHITGAEHESAEFAGITPGHVRRRVRDDAIFAELVQQALSTTYAKLRDAAIHRAIHGTPETYTNKRGETITRQRYDNRLLIDVIDRFLPEIADRRQDARAALEGGIVIKFQIGDGPPELPAGADVELDAEELPLEQPDAA